jgi:prepilin-type N-terminal cleavage/methylation domain-containing protein
MKIPAAHRSRVSRRGGFTLTEISIVLIVFAVIVGVIWSAVAPLGTRARVNQATDQLNKTVNNAFAYYAGQNTSYDNLVMVRGLNAAPTNSPPAGSPTGTDFCYYTPMLAAQKVFPPEMLAAGGPPWIANHPWATANNSCGGGTAVGTAQAALASSAGASPVLLVIRYTNLPTTGSNNVCAQLLMINSLPGPDTRLVQISIMWGANPATNYTGTQLPFSAALANAACTGAGILTIDWYYQLGS